MFNNIIYFLIVLFIFSFNYPSNSPEDSFAYSFFMIVFMWIFFALYCRTLFSSLRSENKEGSPDNGSLAGDYQRIVLRLCVISIFLFTLDVYVFHLKYWLQMIPGIKSFSVAEGILALGLFFLYLGTIWYFSYSVYSSAYGANLTRRAFILSNIKLNAPILFPWLILTLVYDLLLLSPWSYSDKILNEPAGQILFFAVFLIILMVFMPGIIQKWWGCRPFQSSARIEELKAFLKSKGFKYRDIVKWPIFEGRMLTAGIMGLVTRYRYILVTESLMNILSVEELKAVFAHEMGHVKYRHMLFYAFFFLGYMVLSFGLFDIFSYFLVVQPFFREIFERGRPEDADLFYLLLSLPILATMLIYFRYIMGFFMRHFERQADLFSSVIMGSPDRTISSLEKIAMLSGKIRDLPSWHHFSIKERVDCLIRMIREPDLVKRQNRFISISLGVYLICMIGLGYTFNSGVLKRSIANQYVAKPLLEKLLNEPDNIVLYQNLAMVYHELEKYSEAMHAYEQIIRLAPEEPMALNNLAWLLVTASDKSLRDERRGLVLASKAVELERFSPIFLDTLAEAYYANGLLPEAVNTIKDAINIADKNMGYYKKQLRKFESKLGGP